LRRDAPLVLQGTQPKSIEVLTIRAGLDTLPVP
jgi:hypothetical protein